jgi:hypothetical protein
LKTGYKYLCKVSAFKLERKKKRIVCTLENQHPGQLGRRHTVYLPLDVFPGSSTAALLSCLGADTTEPDTTINLDTLAGRHIFLVFNGNSPEPLACGEVRFCEANK